MTLEGTLDVRYHGNFYDSCQEKLLSAASRGMGPERIEAFLVGLYLDEAKKINTGDIGKVTINTIEQRILKPRQDLYRFILINWIRLLFVPTLPPELRDNLLIFGIGRIFSAYSDIGVQYCTDADLNFVLADRVSKSHVEDLCRRVRALQQRMWDLFTIIVEVDSSFTVLRVKDVLSRLSRGDERARVASSLFYKANEKSLQVILPNEPIMDEVFSLASGKPDSLIFENFIGRNPAKPTYQRIRSDEVPLKVVSDDTQESEVAHNLIGSGKFARECRLLSSYHPELHPPRWCFSMKYTVNRAFDYVSSMLNAGYSLRDIGFDGEDDSDYHFLSQAHRLMLFLQELIHVKLDTYNRLSDYSYISAERFAGFMYPPKGSFRSDFEKMVLSPNFLYASQKARYLKHKAAIHDKDELVLSLNQEEMRWLTERFGIQYRHLDKGSGRTPIAIPYTWSGLGFFVFSAVEARLAAIVDEKLAPRKP